MSKKENKLIPKSTQGQYRDLDRGDWSPLDCSFAEEDHPILDKLKFSAKCVLIIKEVEILYIAMKEQPSGC